MFPAQFTITNTNATATQISIDAKFSEDRALRRLIPRGGSVVITPEDATLDELDSNAQIRQLIDLGDIRITMAQGPTVSFSFDVAADAGTDADTLALGTLPFDIVLGDVTAAVSAGVATSTVTLSSGATDYTSAIDTDGTPAVVDATLTTNRAVAAGTQLELDRSATAKAALTLFVTGTRLSV